MKRGIILSALVLLALGLAACTKTDENPPAGDATVTTGAAQPAPGGQATGEGQALGEEILAAFDVVIKEALDLVKGKPEPAVLKPQLQALYAKHEAKMKELNAKYKALKQKDIKEFGACNGYLGENRGKRVFEKDKVLGEFIFYYNNDKKDEEVAGFFNSRMATLIDVATAQ